MTPDAPPKPSVRREGDYAVIRVLIDQVHELRVTLEPCPCRATKSHATTARRAALCAALGKLEARK